MGIRGNERADEAAKSALILNVSAVKCPATDLYADVLITVSIQADCD